jgi:hypothetical protein
MKLRSGNDTSSINQDVNKNYIIPSFPIFIINTLYPEIKVIVPENQQQVSVELKDLFIDLYYE